MQKKRKKEGLRVRVGEGGGGRGSEKYLIVVQRLVNRKRSSRMEWGGVEVEGSLTISKIKFQTNKNQKTNFPNALHLRNFGKQCRSVAV